MTVSPACPQPELCPTIHSPQKHSWCPMAYGVGNPWWLVPSPCPGSFALTFAASPWQKPRLDGRPRGRLGRQRGFQEPGPRPAREASWRRCRWGINQFGGPWPEEGERPSSRKWDRHDLAAAAEGWSPGLAGRRGEGAQEPTDVQGPAWPPRPSRWSTAALLQGLCVLFPACQETELDPHSGSKCSLEKEEKKRRKGRRGRGRRQMHILQPASLQLEVDMVAASPAQTPPSPLSLSLSPARHSSRVSGN